MILYIYSSYQLLLSLQQLLPGRFILLTFQQKDKLDMGNIIGENEGTEALRLMKWLKSFIADIFKQFYDDWICFFICVLTLDLSHA